MPAVIAWPSALDVCTHEVEFTLLSNTVAHVSTLSKAAQTVGFPGARWRVSFRIKDLKEDGAGLLRAWGAKLRGQAGRFTLHHFGRPTPRGTISGTPLVKGAGQSGNTLLIDGCTVGTTLLPGDFFGVNGELKMVVEPAAANGAGEMALTIEPPLRSSPVDNAPIVTDKPTATFMLTEDAWRAITRAGFLSDFAIDAVENWT